MASTQEKATHCGIPKTNDDIKNNNKAPPPPPPPPSSSTKVLQNWSVALVSGSNPSEDTIAKRASMATLIRPVEPISDPPATNTTTSKGISIMPRAQTSHPLDPLSAAEISVAVATVRAAGKTPEVRDSMRFIEVALVEPEKHVVALADAYFFPPFQPSLLPRTKGGPVIPSKLPPRQARLVVYNKRSNETSIWIVELSEVHAATRGGHHRGKVISSKVVPDVQPPMDAMEYAECEAVVKDFPPFREAMKKRGIEDMDLVMVDPWCVGYHSDADAPTRRLAKPLIFCRTESDCPIENGYARPVEGIHVLVDMQNMVVIEFEDRKLVPLPPADPLRNYTAGETRGGVDRSDVKPLQIIQPEGPSFRVSGNFVEWQKWNFRIGFTPREGLVIYSVAYVDGSRGRRPIAHRLSFVEMVVPYGDPNEPHYRKNAFDAGEDGLGKNAHSLKKALVSIGKDDGIKGYWKGNLPQVIRVVPYSAVQLFAYETYKKLFTGKDGELSVLGRLAAGACAGMTSTFITYPLDVLRLRLAVEPGYRKMSEVALTMLREEGFGSFYYGLVPSLIGIAPYIAVNFCIFDLVKRALPEKYRQKTQASLLTAVVSAAAATLTCYPLDTVRRQMQMRGTPYKSVMDAIPGIIERDGVGGLYRGFVPNALKNLPNSSIRLTTFDIVKRLIAASEKQFEKMVDENRQKAKQETDVEQSS